MRKLILGSKRPAVNNAGIENRFTQRLPLNSFLYTDAVDDFNMPGA